MTNIKIQKLKDAQLGEIFVRINPRVKNISIRVRRTCEIDVTCSSVGHYNHAIEFLNQKREWILKQQARYRESHLKITLPLQTRLYEIVARGSAPQSNKTTVYVPADELTGEEIQVYVRELLEKIWRIEAQKLLPERVEMLAQKYGFRFTKLTFRKCRTRWGSCSADNSISLNINLMRLPDELIDFIIIHELCHTIHRNHGPQFHSLVDRCTNGQERELRQKLKKYITVL